MDLKQPNLESRIIFLKKFTGELIISFLKEEQIKKRIEIEKLRNEFIEPQISPEQAFKKIIRTPVVPIEVPEKKEENKLPIESFTSKQVIKRYSNKPFFKKEKSKLREQPSSIYPNEPSPLQTFELAAQPRPEGFNLGKVDLLLRDPLIKMIECNGPDKELTIKKNGRTYTTKITMNRTEIKEVLDSFSRQARIPIMPGVFKAVLGDLMISAMVSDVIDWKFIITRMSQYSLLKQK